ncbi:MAG: hydrolase [Oscillospiraceae bacterium]|nr:hydrolase [Oscillospiraceae bacterium]
MPVIADEITLELCRAGAPGKLTFQVVKDSIISFHEGDRVVLRLGETVCFSGFVFSKRRQYGGVIAVTAYDQLRYLKNRDTYVYEDMTATELLQRVAADWRIPCGELRETGYRLPSRVENGRPILDILQTALDLTTEQTGQVFVLYDEAGRIRLSHVGELALDTLVHTGSMGNFDYTSSIDHGTYSAVQLYRTDRALGETVFYESQRDDLVRHWGMLRYFGRLEADLDGQTAVANVLQRYGRKTRRLQIVDAVGDLRVRGGSLLPVDLYLGDIVVGEPLMVERVNHQFSEGGHLMELTLVGGEFVD